MGYTGLYRTKQEYTRLYRSIQEYIGLNKTIQDYMGLYRTIQDFTGHRTTQDYIELNTHKTTIRHVRPKKLDFGNLWQFSKTPQNTHQNNPKTTKGTQKHPKHPKT